VVRLVDAWGDPAANSDALFTGSFLRLGDYLRLRHTSGSQPNFSLRRIETQTHRDRCPLGVSVGCGPPRGLGVTWIQRSVRGPIARPRMSQLPIGVLLS